jgi:tetratricopeptide (TPR) repeat protein
MHVLHGYQVKGSAHALLRQAERAKDEGRLVPSAKYYYRYLGLRPRDADARAAYGLLLEQLAQTGKARLQALLVLEEVLRQQPGRSELRRHLVQSAMRLGRFGDAKEHLVILLQPGPSPDGELEHLLGECEEGRGAYAQAVSWFQKAIMRGRQRTESYVRLAGLLRARPELAPRLGRQPPEMVGLLASSTCLTFPAALPWAALVGSSRRSGPNPADDVMDALVAANPRSFQSYLIRARYRKQHHLAGAAQDLSRARTLGPRKPEVLLVSSAWALAEGRAAEARKHLKIGLKLYPGNVDMYIYMARLELQGGQPREARDILRRCLAATRAKAQELWTLADLFLDADQPAEARSLITRLRQAGFPPERLDFLEARMEMQNGEWFRASQILERIRPLLASSTDLTKQGDFLLGQCYAEIGNPDQRLAAFRHAVSTDPTWVPGRLGLAEALATVGRQEEALQHYWQLSRLSLEGQVGLARLLMVRNLGLPPADRRSNERWEELDRVLDEASRTRATPVEVALLQAESLLARDRPREAQEVLEGARSDQPARVEPWVALAHLAHISGGLEEALGVLDRAQKRIGDTVPMRLARAQFWVKHPGKKAKAALAKLENHDGRLGPKDRLRLWQGLAEAYMQIDQPGDAERLWERVAERRPGDIHCRLVLFDLALAANRDGKVKRLLGDLKRLEGESGTLWRYGEAARLVERARRGDERAVTAARPLVAEVARRRPQWSRAALLEAEMENLEGNSDQAILHYQRALDLGERQPAVIRQLVHLYGERGRYLEANQLIRKMIQEGGEISSLGRLAAEVSVRTRDFKGALELAKQAVPADSRRYEDHLWLAQIQWASKDLSGAEKELRRAVRLAGRTPLAWVALLEFLAGTSQKAKAEAALEEVRKKLAPPQALLAVARGREALGQTGLAEKAYQEALAARPHGAEFLLAAAAFYLRANQPQRAEPLLRSLASLSTASSRDRIWARRQLAVVWARTGNYQRRLEALALVENNLKSATHSLEDQRAKVVVLAVLPGRQREALALLEKLGTRMVLSADDQFLQARLFEATGQWSRARDKMLDLLAREKGRPGYPNFLAHFVASFLARGESGEAQLWLAKLEELEPETLRTLSLKAQVLAGNRQMDEALEVCDQAGKTVSAKRVAPIRIEALRTGPASPEHRRRVEKWLRAALDQNPRSPVLQLSLANLKDLTGQSQEAGALYRKVLESDSGNLVALNNWAWLLALKEGRGSEALKLVNRAIALAGPEPGLLDTRAVIYLALGRNDEAIEDLDQILRDAPNPAAYFHLALARRAQKDPVAARQAYLKARKEGLKENDLHPLELAAYRKLAKKTGARN